MGLDEDFGRLRQPYKVDAWEVGRAPVSRSVLDTALGAKLVAFRGVCSETLLRRASRCVTYIWAMDAGGTVHIAVEELAEMPDGSDVTGYPRRRDFPRHPSEEKKLGHPCLLDAREARIAGELFLDERSGTLCWFVNVNSGRYCQFVPPNPAQVANLVGHFRRLLDGEIVLDDLMEA